MSILFNLNSNNNWKEFMMKKKQLLILSIVFLNLFSLTILTTVVNAEISTPKTPGVIGGITIDGVINETIWELADHKIEFWIDADPANFDAFNYMYLGEDATHLYIGLDLISDITGDSSGEWVGVWLITNNRTFTNPTEWRSYINNGTEALIYDVHQSQVMNFTTNATVADGHIGCQNLTVSTYELVWGFSASTNNASNHRMFEIKILKSDLELYDPNGYLGVYVAGYGTLSINNQPYWHYPYIIGNWSIYDHRSDAYGYYNMKGLGPAGTNIPGYDIFVLLGVIGVTSVVLIIVKRSRQIQA